MSQSLLFGGNRHTYQTSRHREVLGNICPFDGYRYVDTVGEYYDKLSCST